MKVRQRYYDAENTGQRFQEISITEVFDFLWEIGLFYRISALLEKKLHTNRNEYNVEAFQH